MDTLDTQPAANFDSDEIFNNKTNAEAFMNGVYASLMDDVLYTKYRSSNSGIAWESRTPNSVMCDQVGDGIDGWLQNWVSRQILISVRTVSACFVNAIWL